MGGGLTFVQMREVAPLDPILSFDLDAPSEVKRSAPLLFRLHLRRTNHRRCARSRAALQAENRACEYFLMPSIGDRKFEHATPQVAASGLTAVGAGASGAESATAKSVRTFETTARNRNRGWLISTYGLYQLIINHCTVLIPPQPGPVGRAFLTP
jgi:hypothetical protein